MKVSEIQEWVTLHGFSTKVDNDMGPATCKCVDLFTSSRGLPPTFGEVTELVEHQLVQPMTDALSFNVKRPVKSDPLDAARKLVVDMARHHLQFHPREVGGENRGPWVRLYMGGRQGREWPWCAGFATYLLKMACWSVGVAMPVPYAFGCDYLAGIAQNKGMLDTNPTRVLPGHFFLVRKAPNHWQHIGIVEEINLDVMTTIEGNTNDEGSPEGFEVCRRYRSLDKRDFIIY